LNFDQDRSTLGSLIVTFFSVLKQLFNQITLVCDWWYNVDCSQAESFYDYSNSRLYISKDVHLLDDQDEIMEAIGAVAKPASSSASSSSSSEKKKSKA
jgi:hypothetical protein